LFKNHLKTAFRFFFKNRLYTTISALSLSIAMASSFFILMHVINELSFVRFHTKHSRIFRVDVQFRGTNYVGTFTPWLLAENLGNQFPQIEKFTRMAYAPDLRVKPASEEIQVPDAFYVDSRFFDIFTVSMVSGSFQDWSGNDRAIVISESLAEKLFPGQNAVGREMPSRFGNNDQNLIITGIFKDFPQTSSFYVSCLINIRWSLNNMVNGRVAKDDWNTTNWMLWLLVREKSQVHALQNQLPTFLKKLPIDNYVDQLKLENLADLHLHSLETVSSGVPGDYKNVRLYLVIALVILVVATTNHTLLSTAISSSRAKETAIRKVFFATDRIIRAQILIESILLALIVLPLVIVFIWLASPYTWQLFDAYTRLFQPSNLILYVFSGLLLFLSTGVLTGLYTSFFMRHLNAMPVINGFNQKTPKIRSFRSILIVIQMCIFCTLLTGTLIVFRQYRYANQKDTGYIKKDIIFMYANEIPGKEQFMEDIRSCPEVIDLGCAASELPMPEYRARINSTITYQNQRISITPFDVQYHYLETLGIPLKEGRYFSEEFPGDMKHGVILNEKAVKIFDLTDPVGKRWNGKTIVGIVKDFNCFSVHYPVPAMAITLDEPYNGVVAIRCIHGTENDLIPKLQIAWKRIQPDEPLNFFTVEENLSRLYAKEKKLTVSLSLFCLVTLLIATSGIFGLTLYISNGRIKEIGIKKAMGASGHSILVSFMLEYVLLIFLASALSVPVTMYFMNRWLQNFAYKATIAWWIFALSFAINMIIVLSTIFYHAYKTSQTDPVKALRNE
jgi:putative ABC transport system permease protein